MRKYLFTLLSLLTLALPTDALFARCEDCGRGGNEGGKIASCISMPSACFAPLQASCPRCKDKGKEKNAIRSTATEKREVQGSCHCGSYDDWEDECECCEFCASDLFSLLYVGEEEVIPTEKWLDYSVQGGLLVFSTKIPTEPIFQQKFFDTTIIGANDGHALYNVSCAVNEGNTLEETLNTIEQCLETPYISVTEYDVEKTKDGLAIVHCKGEFLCSDIHFTSATFVTPSHIFGIGMMQCNDYDDDTGFVFMRDNCCINLLN